MVVDVGGAVVEAEATAVVVKIFIGMFGAVLEGAWADEGVGWPAGMSRVVARLDGSNSIGNSGSLKEDELKS